MNIKKVLSFALGPLGSAVFSAAIIPIMAWMFSPADIGRLNVLQITVTFSVLLYTLGLDQAYIREYYESTDQAGLLKSCFMPGFMAILLTMVITAIFSDRLSVFLFATNDARYYWLTLICVLSSFVSKFLSLILRMQERGFAFSMSQILPKALQFLLLCALALLTFKKEFIHLQLTYTIAILAVLFIYLWNTRVDCLLAMRRKIDYKKLKSLLAYSVPLIFASLAYWGLTATSTIALRAGSTMAELGVYSIAMSIASIAAIFQSIFSVVWSPMVYKWAASGDNLDRIDGIARQALAIVCLIFAAAGMFSWLVDFLLPTSYSEVKYILLCCIAQPMMYTLSEITCIGISITRKTMFSLLACVVALIANALLSTLLVPKFGAAGAAMSNAIAFTIFFIARTEASIFLWRHQPRTKMYSFVLLVVTLAVLMALAGPRLARVGNVAWALALPIFIYAFRSDFNKLRVVLMGLVHNRGI